MSIIIILVAVVSAIKIFHHDDSFQTLERTHRQTDRHTHTHTHTDTLGWIATYSVKMTEYKNDSTIEKCIAYLYLISFSFYTTYKVDILVVL